MLKTVFFDNLKYSFLWSLFVENGPQNTCSTNPIQGGLAASGLDEFLTYIWTTKSFSYRDCILSDKLLLFPKNLKMVRPWLALPSKKVKQFLIYSRSVLVVH